MRIALRPQSVRYTTADLFQFNNTESSIEATNGVSQFTPTESHCPGFAPLDNDTSGRLDDCNFGASSTIYFEPGQDPVNLRYLDFWWFLRYNDTSQVNNAFGVDMHQGDWEDITVVLDPLPFPGNPTVQSAFYAEHAGGVWVLGNALGASHPTVFVAEGTHASYAFPCSENCTQPEGSQSPNEAPHDGGAPWGNNDDSLCSGQCAQRFPTEGWPYWAGKWGADGPSPRSPSAQPRFICAENRRTDSTCGRPPDSPPLPSFSRHTRGPKPSDQRQCMSWLGAGVAALACNASQLRYALRHHLFHRRWTLHLHVAKMRSGDSPGLAQVLGEPLVSGDKIAITGRASPKH
jgi:hypothetical protein